MYEAEVNDLVESIDSLPLNVRQRFAEFRDQVLARTVLPWGEHCTECVWPVCYTTCELYTPRADGACRQFIDGMVRLNHKEGLNPYILKLRFKRWAKLWAAGNLRLRAPERASQLELYNIVVGAISRSAPLPSSLKSRVTNKVGYLKRQLAERAQVDETLPTHFLLECFNPNQRTVNLTLTVRPRESRDLRPFQAMISVPYGYKRESVPCSYIFAYIDADKPFEIEIVPNDADDTLLYFGLMDFVKVRATKPNPARAQGSAKHFKCIVWDLDNTLWDGILIEDGPEKIRLRPGVVDVIKETDHRGILHSVASKNSHDDAMSVLRAAGLHEYFLYPQITWQPKSQSIAQVAQLLNIGVDSLAFVDDQPFEREEVSVALPQVTVIDAANYSEIPDRPECDVPVTAESRNRRTMYREQEQREVALKSHDGDYFAFLRSCEMRVVMTPLNDKNIKRAYELAQRTNQMNFSGNKYQEAQLAEITRSPDLQTYVIDCTDRFGAYGIVGFAVIDTREPRLLDLMFSCRVQSKRVEHAVLSYFLRQFVTEKDGAFYATYRKTPKNAPSGQVFEEIGFEVYEDNGGTLSLIFRKDRQIPDDKIVSIAMEGAN